MITPEPRLVRLYSCGTGRDRKNSSKNWSKNGSRRTTSTCSAAMFTTAGLARSTAITTGVRRASFAARADAAPTIESAAAVRIARAFAGERSGFTLRQLAVARAPGAGCELGVDTSYAA